MRNGGFGAVRTPVVTKRRRVGIAPPRGNAGSRGVSTGMKILSEVVAPTTVITALLVYIGWIRNQAYYGYFGVSQGVLKPSLQDYALRSVDVTFGAVTRLVSFGLIFLAFDWGMSQIAKRSGGHKAVRWLIVVLVMVGLVSVIVGLLFILGVTPGFVPSPVVGAIILGAGVVLLLRFGPLAVGAARTAGIIATATLYATLVLALFWAATLYAQDLGQRAAQGVDADPSVLPLVTIFSDTYLDLPGSRVRASQIQVQRKLYFRYTGISLMTYSNDRWFLITGKYGDGYRSSVVVIRDSPSIRVEIAAAP